MRRTVSIVIPCYRNQGQVATTVSEVARAIASMGDAAFEAQFVLVDDGSDDSTYADICAISGLPPHCRILAIRLCKNHGAYGAVAHGLRSIQGDCAIIMAADGDDPPDLIPHMLRLWGHGNRLVQAIRQEARGGPLHRMAAWHYRGHLRRAGFRHVPPYGADFLLADRAVVGKALREGFLPGNTLVQLAHHADQAATIPYQKRTSRGSWSLAKKAELFFFGILMASPGLQRALVPYAAFLSGLLGLALFVLPWGGWAMALLSFAGIEMLSLLPLAAYQQRFQRRMAEGLPEECGRTAIPSWQH